MLKFTFRFAVTCLLTATCVSTASAGHHHHRYAYTTVYNPYNLHNPSFGVAWGYNPWLIVQPVTPIVEPAPPTNPGAEPGIEAAAQHHAAARQAQEDFLANEDELLGRAMDTLEEIRAIRESLSADAPGNEMPAEATQSDEVRDDQLPPQPE